MMESHIKRSQVIIHGAFIAFNDHKVSSIIHLLRISIYERIIVSSDTMKKGQTMGTIYAAMISAHSVQQHC